VLYTLVGIAFSLALPLAFRFLIDNILGSRPLQMAIPLVGGPGHVIADGTEQLRHLLGLSLFLGLLYLLNGAARWRLTTLVNRLGEAFAHDLRQRQLDVLTRLPAAYFARTPIADINQRVMHDTASVQVVLTGALVPLLAGLLSIALYSVMLISIQAQLALLAFLAIPILGLIYRVRRRNLMAAVRERARRMADLSGRVNELAAAQALVKIYTAAPALLRALGGRLDLHRQLNIAYAQESSVLGQASGLVMHLIQVAVLLVGGYLVVIGNGEDLTPGELVAFYMLMNQLFGPVTSVAAARQTIAGASASAERVSDLLDEAPEHDPPNGVELGQLKESICLEAVTFAYPGGRPVLQDLDLTIPAGSTVAFVGPTGAGKSSLVQLLPRLYDATAGRVSWDGVDLRSARLESLRRQVALVPQDSLLVSGTVAENIRFGLAEATDAALESAARQAGAHEFIVGLSEGYDTLLGDHGVGLSGGQRQRIALARALLRQPSVLILDEATSALDSTTQRIVQEALRADPRRTIVKIAHRLETVADARVIFVLDGGRLVEQGTHKALLAKDGVYARLFRDQMSLLTAAGKPTARQAVRWLARFSPFAELSPAVREELATVIQTVERPAGETIYRAGSAGDELYVVGRGRVDVLLTDESGRQQIVNTLGTGTLFGVEAFFRAQPRATSVHTSTDVLLFVLPRVGYQAVLERSSGVLATGISV
jgi:ABC-type multidrug transport system fused ATPase/permease subunit